MTTFRRKALFSAILAALTLGVDSDPAPPAGGAAPVVDPPDDELPDLEADVDPPAGGSDPPPDDADAKVRAATERAERAEREAAEHRARAEAAERSRSAAPPPQDEEARLRVQEDAEIEQARQSNNADTLKWAQWRIENSRRMRASEMYSQQALREAADARDRTAYEGLCARSPVAKKYSERVEKARSDFAAKGQVLDRKVLLKLLIGDDIVEGRVKTKAKPAAPAPKQEGKVERRPPGHARSDVSGRARASDSAARIARLDGQQI